MCAVTDTLLVTNRQPPAIQNARASRDRREIEWLVALLVMLSIGLDPSLAIWRATSATVPPEFRTITVSASDVALLILVLYGWCAGDRAREVRRHDTSRAITWAGVILLGCLLLSAFVAGERWLSLARAAEVTLGLLAFRAIARRRSLAQKLLVAGAGMILLELPQVILQEISQTSVSLGSPIPGWPDTTAARVPGALVVFGPGNERWQRGMGSFLHPNLLGAFLALAIVFALPWLARERHHVWVLWSVWAVAWIELLLTFSRSALLAAVVGCLLWSIAYMRQTRSRRALALAGVPLAAIAGLLLVVGSVLLPRLDPVSALHGVSVTDRWRLIEIGAQVIVAHPFIGVGAGNFSLAESRLPLSSMSVQPIHVVPLLVAAEAGVVAGLAWLALIVAGPVVELRSKWTDYRLCCERIAVLIVVLILASLDHYFWTFAPGQAIFWVALGSWAARPEVNHRLDFADLLPHTDELRTHSAHLDRLQD
jgi:hypothetical protein